MRARTLATSVALAVVAGLTVLSTMTAAAAPSNCNPGDPGCVIVIATGSGSPGTPGTTTSGDGQGGAIGVVATAPANCSQFLSPYMNVCLSGRGGGTLPPCLTLYTQYRTQLTPAALNAFLSANGCPVLPPAVVAAGPAPPSPATLAAQAAASFQLPKPAGSRSPLVTDTYAGVPITYVNLWTLFWTSPVSWRSLSATASAGGNSATVVATPVSLTFDPGDGTGSVGCAGPGRPWTTADGNNQPSQGACGFRYAHVTGPGYDHPITATQTITWRLTWTGTGNTRGVLTARTSSTSGPLNVLQIQTVDTDPSTGGGR